MLPAPSASRSLPCQPGAGTWSWPTGRRFAAVSDPEASWEALRPANVIGTYQVVQAAVHCRVRRLVLASSLRAVSGYPEGVQLRADDAPRPASIYGTTKAWAEALGAWVASTSATSVVALRIGHFALQSPAGTGATARDIAARLSPRDCGELLRCPVEAEGIRFAVASGVSPNRYRAADVSDAANTIGCRPNEDAWTCV